MSEVNKAAAEEMVGRAKRLAPQDQGVLIDSIHFRKGPRETSFIVQAGGTPTTIQSPAGSYDYAVGQEFGNTRVKAHPFFWPSYRTTKRSHKQKAGKVLRKTIKDAGF